MKIGVKELDQIVFKILRTKYRAEDARKIADLILFGELSGRKSHGLIRLLPNQYGPLDERPKGRPKVMMRSPVSSLIDGRGNPAMLVATLGMEEALRLASRKGVGIVGTCRTFSSSGALSFYLEKIAEKGFIGMIMTNPGSGRVMVPHDGGKPLFGTNPISFGFPMRPRPLLFDMSLSAISWGDFRLSLMKGKRLPPGVAVDLRGRVTQNPEEVLKGGLLPFVRNYKGSGLALVVEILSGLWVNAAACGLGRERRCYGHLFFVFSPKLLIAPAQFERGIKGLCRLITKRSGHAGSSFRIPGEKTLKERDRALTRGYVDVEPTIFKALRVMP
jgi:LDH2 family malate/lactate/ureidoglycolate dehydrogenase